MKKILMTIALLCTVAQGAWAEDVNYIYYMVIDTESYYSLQKATGTASNPTVLTSKLLEDSSEDNLNTGWYVLSSSFSYRERIVISGDVHLILKDGCTLTAEQGIRINTDAKLSIYAQSEDEATMGKLVAIETHHDKAAIGGNKNYLAGRLDIHGGNIEATCKDGSKYAAGIGGGYGDGSGMESISIFGGKVTAQGAYLGAGIGGGKNNNNPGSINIYGGTVGSTGGEYGAGIGGGENRAGWRTNIYGGDIRATGGFYGAGIGGGEEGGGGTLHFFGGKVRAYGGKWAAGIGAGEDGDGGTVIIDGGNIGAWGKEGAPGIGGGATRWPPHGRKSGTITINDGLIEAHGSYEEGSDCGGAGIGSGNQGTVENITINGGNIKAYGSTGAAGIGGGHTSKASGVIKITGGSIYAQGDYIYLGWDEAGDDVHAGTGIGAGCCSKDDCEINISGTPYIEAVGATGAAAIGAGLWSTGYLNISITGGHIRATVSNAGSMPMLIGVGGDSEGKYAHVTIADGLALWAGENIYDNTIQEHSKRVSVCTGRQYKYGDINTHAEHTNIYEMIDDSKHTAFCKYCKKSETEAHAILATGGTCEKCGYGEAVTTHTLAFFQTSSAINPSYSSSGFQAIAGSTITLPSCNSVPYSYDFVGWLKSSNPPASIEAADSETLLQPGDSYTVDEDARFFARYRFDFTPLWDWDDNLNSASLNIQAGNNETISVPQVTISNRKVTKATAQVNGSITATATATYLSGNASYSFSKELTKELYYDVSLGEEDNTETLTTFDGRTLNITLAGRTLYKNGNWNTLCLPYDVADISSSPLAGATIKEFTDVSFDKSTNTLTLTFAAATSIKAGQAYLVKWNSGSNLGPSDLIFNGATLTKNLRDDEITTDDEDAATVAFTGTYKKLTFDEEDRSVLFLGADNTLYYPKKGATIGAQRAYFKLSGITAGDKTIGSARTFVLDFGDNNNTTGVIELKDGKMEELKFFDSWYSLDGKYLSGKPAQKGIYINNGKKIIIK